MSTPPGVPGALEPDAGRGRALALLSLTLVFSMSTWFSASAVIPQLRAVWHLSPTQAAWLTIAAQVGFVCGARGTSGRNRFHRCSPRHVILGGSRGAAPANAFLHVAGGAEAGIPLRFVTG